MDNSFIPYGHQWIEDDDIASVVEALKGDYLTQGPKIKEFEEKVAAMAGTKYAVAFSNGTAALHAACFAAGLEHGDEVITSPLTFAASANCALYVGAKPIFADIDINSYNISPIEIRKNISSRTKAIIPVHFTGNPCELDTIMEIAKEYDLIVIQDAAHAVGALYRERKIGSMGHMTMFSFHPVKQITTGEGGVIVTDHEGYFHKLEMFRTHGITRNPEFLSSNEGPWYYEQKFLGYNYRMTDIQAALGCSQMKKLEQWQTRREEIASCYQKAFSNIQGLITPVIAPDVRSGWHLYVLRFDEGVIGKSRRQLFDELRIHGIGVNVHYIPVYWHPWYQELGYGKGLCPVAETVYKGIISLPLFPKMTNREVDRVIETVLKIIT